MWPFKSTEITYIPISVLDRNDNEDGGLIIASTKGERNVVKTHSRQRWLLLAFTCFGLVFGIFTFGLKTRISSFSISEASKPSRLSTCIDPPRRREWRTLSRDQKSEYINAVRCLSTHSSGFRDEATLYDDFPWVHVKSGRYCELRDLCDNLRRGHTNAVPQPTARQRSCLGTDTIFSSMSAY